MTSSSARTGASDAVAAIDVGTNTILQLVARRAANGALEVLDDRCVTARLGEGLVPGGALTDAALARSVDVVADLLDRAHELGVPLQRVRAVGTAVLRRASDAARFVDAVRARTGLAVETLSEEDEARLGFLAVTGDGAGANAWIVDVGGGSTEVAGDGGAVRVSAPVGAVTLSAEHGAYAGDAASFDALYARAREACAAFPSLPGGATLIALGGTASNLACLDIGERSLDLGEHGMDLMGRGADLDDGRPEHDEALTAFDPARAEGHVVRASAALDHARRLWQLPPDLRRRLPIEADRAEILPAGLACLAAAFERLGAGAARVSGRGLRYGLAREVLGL